MSDDQTPQISHEEKLSEFKRRFATVMLDMGNNVKDDREMVWLIGSLASNLVTKAKLNTWTELKGALSKDAFNGLLATFQKEGNDLAAKGNKKATYAVEILGISLITMTMPDDEHIKAGDGLLNQMIEDTIVFYRQESAARAARQQQQNPN